MSLGRWRLSLYAFTICWLEPLPSMALKVSPIHRIIRRQPRGRMAELPGAWLGSVPFMEGLPALSRAALRFTDAHHLAEQQLHAIFLSPDSLCDINCIIDAFRKKKIKCPFHGKATIGRGRYSKCWSLWQPLITFLLFHFGVTSWTARGHI